MAGVPPWTIRPLAAAVALLLTCGVLAVVVHDDDTDDGLTTAASSTTTTGPSSSSSTTTDGSPSKAPSDPERDRAVAELIAFVERARGLEFKAPVEVDFLAPDEFRERLLGDMKPTAQDRREVEEVAGALRALGLLEPGIDLIEAFEDLLGAGVVGFYSYDTKSLAVRGEDLGPYTRSVVVHELTHALDDQHFGLERPALDEDSEASGAFEALVEGDAMRVEEEYVDTLSPREKAAYDEAEEDAAGEADFEDLPEVVVNSTIFPYAFGPDFVEEVLDDGGERAVDAAFGEPPTTTEQILVPPAYFDGDEAKPVAEPKAEAKKRYSDVIGAWFLYLVLAEELDGEQAVAASRGWGGDRFVTWVDGDRTCLAANFVMDTAADTAELRDALAEWAEAAEDAQVAGDDPVTLRSCA